MPPPRAALLTIGQTPRTDLVPELRSWLTRPVAIEERGALDGMSAGDIAALAPAATDDCLVSRLSSGDEVTLTADWVHERMAELCAEAVSDGFDITVLLCTGRFPRWDVDGLVLEAQRIVDAGLVAMAGHVSSIGVLVPHARQIGQIIIEIPGTRVAWSHATPYPAARLEAAAEDLATADLIVMHCIGYSDAMRAQMAKLTGKPVLLARRMVAAAIDQLL